MKTINRFYLAGKFAIGHLNTKSSGNNLPA
jgi:hypothetical protein